jgi:hypothetical protein
LRERRSLVKDFFCCGGALFPSASFATPLGIPCERAVNNLWAGAIFCGKAGELARLLEVVQLPFQGCSQVKKTVERPSIKRGTLAGQVVHTLNMKKKEFGQKISSL